MAQLRVIETGQTIEVSDDVARSAMDWRVDLIDLGGGQVIKRSEVEIIGSVATPLEEDEQ
jgi:hypothetical protein